jgi:hypothetical protein
MLYNGAEKRKDIIHLTDRDIEAIYDSGKENTIAYIKYLINEINSVKAEIQELKANLSKNSHNSNKPPSSGSDFKSRGKLFKQHLSKPV